MWDNTFSLFIYELKKGLETNTSIKLSNPNLPLTLNTSMFEALQRIQEAFNQQIRTTRSANISLTSSDRSSVYVEITYTQTDATKACPSKNLPLIVNLKEVSTQDNGKLMFSKEDLNENGHFFTENNTLCTIPPSRGTFRATRERPSIAICTPVFKRFKVLELYIQYTVLYLLPQLIQKGYDPYLVIAGDEDEFKVLEPYMVFENVIFLQHFNNLGDKKNLLLKYASKGNFDYLCFIDSDDLFSINTLDSLIKTCDGNGFWSAIEGFCFLDVASMRVGVFEGYAKSKKSLYGWGMGSGRVFSKRLIAAMDENPFARKNKSMDYYIRQSLDIFAIPKGRRLLPYTPSATIDLPIGLKSDENIWGYDAYPLKEVALTHPQVNWLPQEIVSKIKHLP